MKRFFFTAAGLAASALWLAPACSPSGLIDVSVPEGGVPTGDGGTIPTLGGVGAACDAVNVCRPGLSCSDAATCQPAHSTEIGAMCQISAECKDGFCAALKCAPAGTGDTGATCATDGDCKAGLRCNIVGLATQCQAEGTKDLGGACQTSADCYGGIFCNAMNQCALPDPTATPIGIPKFTGVPCEAETGDVRAYFDVPRGGAALKDFFRLPYPNDIRMNGTKLDLKDFPTPGTDLLGFDLVDRWARFLEQTGDGYSAYPAVIFRFSGEIDFNSLDAKGVTNWVDLTTQQPLGLLWSSRSAKTNYVCPNWMAFRPPTGVPLIPGHKYAVFMTTATKTKDGKAIAVSDDLKALLSTTPATGDLATAWTKYQPLRDYAKAQTFDLSSILNVSVFTVGDHDAIGKTMSTTVVKATAPATWTKCDAGTTSPCAQHDADRNCPATPNAAFDEYHAVLKMPLYQQGKIPYIAFGDNGLFDLSKSPQMIDVCAAVTMPKGGATPLKTVVYAHGTGGSFRSHATENVAPRMAGLGIAVLGIDQVGHGTRRGDSTADPSVIFFNFTNPPAAQGNVLQGAADQVALVKMLIPGITVGSATLGGTSTIAYWGHSQGATEGAVSMPYTAGVSGVLFSGEGGSIIDSLLTKTSPTNIAALGPIILSEKPADVNNLHPVFTMFQNAIDPADPLDHALNANPTPTMVTNDPRLITKHVFVPYGQKDTYATPITQLNYITAAGLFVAANAPSATTPDKLNEDPRGIVSVSSKDGKHTTVTRQYGKPATADGHFVAFDDPDAIKDTNAFLSNALNGVPPTVPAP